MNVDKKYWFCFNDLFTYFEQNSSSRNIDQLFAFIISQIKEKFGIQATIIYPLEDDYQYPKEDNSIYLPIISRNHSLGFLLFHNMSRMDIDSDDLDFLQHLTKLLAMIIKNHERTNLAYFDHLGLKSINFLFDWFKEQNLIDNNYLLLMAGLDGLKDVNDDLGSTAGDQILIDFGTLLHEFAQTYSGESCHYFSDIFIVCLPKINTRKDIQEIIDSFIFSFNKWRGSLHDICKSLTLSIGYSLYPEDCTGFEESIEKTKSALEKAKKFGGNKTLSYKNSIKPSFQQTFSKWKHQKQLFSILEIINTGILVLDRDYNLKFANSSASSILDIDLTKSYGSKICDILNSAEVEPKNFYQMIQKKPFVKNKEYKLTLWSKPKYFLISTYYTSENEEYIYDENFNNIIVSFVDITEMKKKTQLISDMEKLSSVGQMAAGLAHELRNPLTTIKGFTSYLKEKLSEEPIEKKFLTYLQLIVDEAERTNKLITNFLDFAKPTKPTYTRININSIITEVLEISKGECLKNKVQVLPRLDYSIPYTYLDPNQIKQVLFNLVLNAVEALTSQPYREVRIETYWDEVANLLYIEVVDNGPGIPENVLSQISTPFFTTKETGTGLGLSISYQIINQHYGKIWADSVKGQGTMFTLCLPITSSIQFYENEKQA